MFVELLDIKHGDDEIGRAKAIRCKHHDCVGMKLDFSSKGKLKIDMQHHIKDMSEDFPVKLKSTDTALTPANESLFSVDNSKPVDKSQAEQCHTFVAKGLFVSKRGRPDTQPATAGSCTQAQEPNEGDWTKVVKTHEVFKWHKRVSASVNRQQFKIHQMACRCSICCAP